MNKLLCGLWCVMLTAGPILGAQEFSRRLSPDDFAAAGLDKLTPAELARLDALVRKEQSGEIARVQAETTARVKAEAKADAVAKPADKGGMMHRLRVVLAPGTDIEYAAVETQLTGSFRGYERGKVLTLSNGQRWRVVEGSFWAPARDANKPRKVIIEPGLLGGFFLNIEDGGRPKVEIVNDGR